MGFIAVLTDIPAYIQAFLEKITGEDLSIITDSFSTFLAAAIDAVEKLAKLI